jgi:hypothetical protein
LTPISKTVQRVFEFFSTQINDGHPHGLQQLTTVLHYHVVPFVNDLQGTFRWKSSTWPPPGRFRKLRMARIRLFWVPYSGNLSI